VNRTRRERKQNQQIRVTGREQNAKKLEEIGHEAGRGR
jgi:hypothetical protein